MKALVVTNCATAAYTTGLRLLFPDWDVKGADIAAARKFTADNNTAFLDHLSNADLLLTSVPDDVMFEAFHVTRLFVPTFYFRAHHPDSFHLGHRGEAVSSVLGSGNLHSRLVVAAFVLGLPEGAAAAAFDGRIYESIGYLSVLESEREELLRRFGEAGIDLSEAFPAWLARGTFLYTYNHPRAFVFNDILLAAVTGRFLAPGDREAARTTLSAVPDYLEDSVRWPVYPEIASRHGFEGSLVWRTGREQGYRSLPRDQFVARTYETLSGLDELTPAAVPGFEACADAIGG